MACGFVEPGQVHQQHRRSLARRQVGHCPAHGGRQLACFGQVVRASEMNAPIYVAELVLSAVEAARSPESSPPANLGMGAAEIVTDLIENWPRDPKPTKGQSRR